MTTTLHLAPSATRGAALLRYCLRGRRSAVIRVVAWSAGAAVPGYATGMVLATAMDDGFLKGRTGAGLAWLALLVGVGVAAALARRSLVTAVADVVDPVRDQLISEVVGRTLGRAVARGLPTDGELISGLGETGGAGATATQASDQVETIRQVAAALLRSLPITALTLVSAVVGLSTLAPILLVPVVAMMIPALLATWWLSRVGLRLRHELLLVEESVAETARQVLTATGDATVFAATGRICAPAEDRARRAAAVTVRLARLSAVQSVVLAVCLEGAAVMVLLASPWLLQESGISPGALIGAVYYILHGLAPATRAIAHHSSGWGTQLAAASSRLADVLGSVGDGPEPLLGEVPEAGVRDGHDNRRVPGVEGSTPVAFDVRVHDLSFGYPQGRPLLSGVHLKVPGASRLVLVGASGEGKTTLAALLGGLLAPTSGRVLLGGRPVTAWPEPALRATLCYVGRDPYLFTGSVRENLTYLSGPVGSDQVETAVAAFGLRQLVERWGGLDAPLPTPDQLSLGERQRLGLARVWLSPAKIVILDEATANLDPDGEAAAEELLHRQGRTVVVVAHRLSSAVRADQVALVADGTVVTGTHQELVATQPRYRSAFAYWSGSQGASTGDHHREGRGSSAWTSPLR